MNRLIYKLVLVSLTLFTLASCGGKGRKSEQQAEQDKVMKANQMIAYTNKIIDESNHMGQWVDNHERHVITLAQIAAKPSMIKDPFHDTFFMSNSLFMSYKTRSSNNEFLDLTIIPQNAFDTADFDYFTTNVASYYEAKTGLRSLYDKVKVYVDEENFKDDKGELGRAYADSVKMQYFTMMQLLSEMSERAVDLGTEAELLTLDDSPLKDVILLMRAQMKLSRDLLEHYESYKEEEFSKENMQKLCEEYLDFSEKTIAKAGELKLTETQQRYFDKFLGDTEKLKGFAKVAARDLRNDGEIQDLTMSSFGIYFDGLISSYNDVVSSRF